MDDTHAYVWRFRGSLFDYVISWRPADIHLPQPPIVHGNQLKFSWYKCWEPRDHADIEINMLGESSDDDDDDFSIVFENQDSKCESSLPLPVPKTNRKVGKIKKLCVRPT